MKGDEPNVESSEAKSSLPKQGGKVNSQGKCDGCGDGFVWQGKNNLPICTSEVCAMRSHPDFNGSKKSWQNSFIGEAYANDVKSSKGDPVYHLVQAKRLTRDGNNRVVLPGKLEDNIEVSSNCNLTSIKTSKDVSNLNSTSSSNSKRKLDKR